MSGYGRGRADDRGQRGGRGGRSGRGRREPGTTSIIREEPVKRLRNNGTIDYYESPPRKSFDPEGNEKSLERQPPLSVNLRQRKSPSTPKARKRRSNKVKDVAMEEAEVV